MSERLHIVLQSEEKARYRAIAEREGVTLSDWIRTCVRERAEQYATEKRLRTSDDLDRFFAELDRALDPADGPEPDWPEYERLIDEGRRAGLER